MEERDEQMEHDEHERPAPGHREGGDSADREGGDVEAEPVYQPPKPEAAVEDDSPGPGGYPDRDPQDEMPRVPSAPETQDGGD
jgi:hypothetical protein